MKWIWIAATVFLLFGCKHTSYTPATMEGAHCKIRCSGTYSVCINVGSVHCKKANEQCVSGCEDLDRLRK